MDGSRKAPLRRISAWISLWLSLIPAVGAAQAANCHVPPRLDVPAISPGPGDAPVRVAVASYVLALSWSPQFCRDRAEDEQCDPANGRFGFIVHGLWPQGAGRARPQWCAGPPLPEAVARAQYCTTPSVKLLAREWAKHGACATTNPADYFAASRKLFAAIRLPDMDALSRRPLDIGAFKRALAAVNPLIRPSALIVETDRGGGWLREVRVCLTRDLMPQSCSRGQGGGAPDGAPLRIWRAAR